MNVALQSGKCSATSFQKSGNADKERLIGCRCRPNFVPLGVCFGGRPLPLPATLENYLGIGLSGPEQHKFFTAGVQEFIKSPEFVAAV